MDKHEIRSRSTFYGSSNDSRLSRMHGRCGSLLPAVHRHCGSEVPTRLLQGDLFKRAVSCGTSKRWRRKLLRVQHILDAVAVPE